MRRKKRIFEHVEVSLTPLIDTVLVLLIVFMLAAPVVYNAIKISLPLGSVSEHRDSKDDLFYVVEKDGSIYQTGNKKISYTALKDEVKLRVTKTPQLAVVLFVDKKTYSGDLIELIDVIKQNGVKYVYCKTKKNLQ